MPLPLTRYLVFPKPIFRYDLKLVLNSWWLIPYVAIVYKIYKFFVHSVNVYNSIHKPPFAGEN
jgi:hypothetical protein